MTSIDHVGHRRSLAATRRHRVILAVSISLLLSGCTTFSPDGGMTAVADIAGNTIKKDVIAIRSVDDPAEGWFGNGAFFVRRGDCVSTVTSGSAA